MPLDDDAAYLALKARDARFDGRLFVGVTTTGIYCRPVCRVRTPRRENCRFFTSRARAEAARFRPCMKCRPEIAPGWSHTDVSASLAHSAARWMEGAVQEAQPLPMATLAARLGVSERHLRRIFVATHGVSPRDYLGTQRLLLAKHLLTDTSLPVAQVALASGFESLRRFNAAFLQAYRMAPTQLRRGRAPEPDAPCAAPSAAGTAQGTQGPVEAGAIAGGLRLAWRPPLDAAALLGFFARRALPGVEVVDGLHLRRTLAWPQPGGGRVAGWVALQFQPQQHEVRVQVAASLAPVLGGVLQRVRQALDLDADPALIDPVLARLPVPLRPGTRLPGAWDGFETAVRVVLGQQVTVQTACTLAQRLVQRFGTPVATPCAGLTHLFPDAAALAAADPAEIGRLGIVRQRVRALQALAAAVVAGHLNLHRNAPLQPTLDALRALPGIGDWTAQVIALRVLAWPDAWPANDVGLMQALGSRDARQITQRAEAWRPWRSYAVMRLWHHLEHPE